MPDNAYSVKSERLERKEMPLDKIGQKLKRVEDVGRWVVGGAEFPKWLPEKFDDVY